MADNRPGVYFENGQMVIRASALGDCMLSLWGMANRVQPVPLPRDLDEKAATSARAGNVLEEEIITRVEEELGVEVVDRQRVVEIEVVPGKLVVRGHIDGLTEISTPDFDQGHDFAVVAVVDAKGLSNYAWGEMMKAPEQYTIDTHGWQQSTYGAGIGAVSGIIGYLRREHHELRIEQFDLPYARRDIERRAYQLYRHYHDRTEPACENPTSRFSCLRYRHIHPGKEDVEETGRHQIFMEGLEELAERWLGAKRAAQEARRLDDQYRDEMKIGVGPVPEGGAVVDVGAYEVVVGVRKGNVDWSALVAGEFGGVLTDEVKDRYRKEATDTWTVQEK